MKKFKPRLILLILGFQAIRVTSLTMKQVGFATIQRRDIPLKTIQAQLKDIFASVEIVRHPPESKAAGLAMHAPGFLGTGGQSIKHYNMAHHLQDTIVS
jgi:hypothetical protein